MELETPRGSHIVTGTEPWTRYTGVIGAKAAIEDVNEASPIWAYLNNRFGRWLELSIKSNASDIEQQERADISEKLNIQFTPRGRQPVQNEWYGRTHPFIELGNRQLLEVLRNTQPL